MKKGSRIKTQTCVVLVPHRFHDELIPIIQFTIGFQPQKVKQTKQIFQFVLDGCACVVRICYVNI